MAAEGERLVAVAGEADHEILAGLQAAVPGLRICAARDLPLPLLGAVLARARRYFGHDTGVSHLAAAVGAPATVIFGPTDPSVWAPKGANARIVTAPRGDLRELRVSDVL